MAKVVRELIYYIFNIFLACYTEDYTSRGSVLICSSLENFYSLNNNENLTLDIYGLVIERKLNHDLGPLKSSAFSNRKDLLYIKIIRNINKIEQNVFDGLQEERKEIMMVDNNIPILEAGSFNTSGASLILDNNNIEKIEPGAFGNFETISLSHNKLTTIKKGIFTNLKSSKLKLSCNKINNIEEESFFGMNRLRRLDLTNNELTHFDPNILFGNTENLLFINLGQNKLNTIDNNLNIVAPNLKNIYFIDLDSPICTN